MVRKVKYDLSFKLECVKLVVEEHHSCCFVSKQKSIEESMVRRWVDSYNHYGLLGLEPRKSQTVYTVDFKLKVLNEIENNHLSLREARLKFNIPSDSIIIQWQRKMATFGLKGLEPKPRGRPKTMADYKRKKRKSDKPLTREEELLLENERLRCEVDFLKKFNALIQAEEDQLKGKKSKPLKN